MDFLDFLIKSKKNTYASSKITDKLNKDGSKELIFEENEYKYVDRYFGYNPFSGLEVVFRQDEYIWSMSYYGRIKSNEVSEKEVYSFLKQALLNVNENFPLRGPSVFKKEDLSKTYHSGFFKDADMSKISKDALKRGKTQVGTLGQGNHFIDVLEVSKIFSKEVSKQFGLLKGQLVIML
ncbi:hypothetical protein EOM09_09165, partial [bacterium]|nr:hypothetical protein [bacterium]